MRDCGRLAAVDQVWPIAGELTVGEHDLCPAVTEPVLELGRRPAPAQRHGDCSGRDRAEDGLRAEDADSAKDGDRVTGPYPEPCQPVRDGPRPLYQLALLQPAIVADDGT